MDSASPNRPEPRISDADRERAVQRLSNAVAEGRLTVTEFEERVAAVLAARTASDLAPHLADLPAGSGAEAAPEHGELRTTMSTVKRVGRWVVPRRLSVNNKLGTVVLDLTGAVRSHQVVEVALESYMATTKIVVPRGATVNVEGVESSMVASTVRTGAVPASSVPAGDPHVVITGKQYAATLRVRHQRRFLFWRW